MKRKRTLLLGALLLGILALSIALNAALFDKCRQYYYEMNATRLDPYGLACFETGEDARRTEEARRESDPRRTVVFVGDSRALDWTSPSGRGAYRFLNRGINTQTTEQVLGRLEAHIAPLGAEVVVLQAGINDLKTIPLFPENRAAIVSRCKANLDEIVALCRSAGAAVVVTTIFPTGAVPLARRPFWSDDVTVAIDEVNRFIRTLAEKEAVLFDAAKILTGPSGGLREGCGRDLLHLTEEGYSLLNGELVPLLESLVR